MDDDYNHLEYLEVINEDKEIKYKHMDDFLLNY